MQMGRLWATRRPMHPECPEANGDAEEWQVGVGRLTEDDETIAFSAHLPSPTMTNLSSQSESGLQ